jgi:hypothetical protein
VHTFPARRKAYERELVPAMIGYILLLVTIPLLIVLWARQDAIKDLLKPRPSDMKKISPGWNAQMGYDEPDRTVPFQKAQSYADHIKEGGAVIMVRTTARQPADSTAAILRNHSARTSAQKDGPAIRRNP